MLFIGATNRPQELDDAIRRRFVKKLYIPLPNKDGRQALITSILKKESELGKKISISESEIETIALLCKGFSGADVRSLCQAAIMQPIRRIMKQQGRV